MPSIDPRRPRPLAACAAVLALALAAPAFAAGARHFKSGPIQITADGIWVWSVNPDNNSVSRLDTRSDALVEFPLPGAKNNRPLGLSVREDGREVWVACHDTDTVFLLDAAGQVLGSLALGRGTGPYGVALSPDQSKALVTLHRAAGVALLDTRTRGIVKVLEPMYWSPLGVAWMDDGVTAWVTHLFADGEDPSLSRIDTSGPDARVTTRILAKSTEPKQSSRLAAPSNIAEGGYLTFRGHLAQIPAVSGRAEVWLPTQYNNINEDVFTPDSTIQSTIRRLDMVRKSIPNTNNDKVILTAVQVHDPATRAYVGPGWNARISGPIDIGFTADAATAYVLNEQSNDLIVVPVGTPAANLTGLPGLGEIGVGFKPIGLALSPVADTAYVANQLSRSISIVDLSAPSERQVPATPLTGEPFAASILLGAKLFHSSVDPAGLGRISINEKVACASCHPHAEHDGRTWDFENLPGSHGPRNSMSLLGIARTHAPGQRDPINNTWGLLHRSGDRDEIQDFDFTFTGVSMQGAGFLGPLASPELGPPNAGRSSDLDAMADYLLSLPAIERSPRRRAGGQLSEAGERGATFFVGANRAGRRADAGCAGCHVPETGWVDGTSHDVGSRRPGSENELNNRTPAWTVNTPTLEGVWTSPPYTGVATYSNSLVGVIQDAAARGTGPTPHGRPDGLTGRQVADLAEFVASIDGNATAAEARGARDSVPPRIVRVEPASLTTLDVWFSETIDPTSAVVAASWELVELGAGPVAIAGARWDAQNGDRVTLTTQMRASCNPVPYQLRPVGTILDAADWATGGVASAVDLADPGNTHVFAIGTTLTVTLGAWGYENITVPVHDSGMVGPGLATWGHDSPWLFLVTAVTPNVSNKGFVRFDWLTRFQAVTGVAAPADILDAAFSIYPELGDSQTLLARRCLQPWSDTPTGADWNSNPTGAPTWNHASSTSVPWNTPGARAVGGTGTVPGDYNASFDVSGVVDAAATMPAINERVWFAGPLVTDAFRFWMANPALDHGYAVELDIAGGSNREAKFDRWENELREYGPVLRITYSLGSLGTPAPGEDSGLAGRAPLYAVKAAGGGVTLSFEDLAVAQSYNVYEGTLGSWFSHAGAACNVAAPRVGARREWTLTPATGRAYLQVTASNACAEGPAAAGWPAALLDCLP